MVSVTLTTDHPPTAENMVAKTKVNTLPQHSTSVILAVNSPYTDQDILNILNRIIPLNVKMYRTVSNNKVTHISMRNFSDF
jgi:thiamine phosphate synthase YjbQ (UPF0047 family)